MSEKEDYFSYVENVLGIKSVLLNTTSVDVVEAIQSPLIFLVQDLSDYTDEENELLQKMVAALKIDSQKIQIADARMAEKCTAEFKVSFVNNVEQAKSQLVESSTSLVTHSPRYLLKNPKFKKQAWDDLQKVIRFFA